jgi:putative membrane-bound dehydrogenase-like protein
MGVAQKVPQGFKCEILFRPPEVEHPSAVTCDDDGNLFIGEDPMDMRGPSTKEFDRIQFVRWDPNGGKPRKTVFCKDLSAVFGLQWYDGWLYVMHAPHYSRFRDTDGDGVADVREDLAEGFGPPAGVFGFNDHIVTGIRLGMDGWMYVSVGDKGIQKAVGKDKSTITLEGGGVVRMRPDGTRLQVFSTGTRNHLDVAMDKYDNIFTYDNTDDGLGWWTRLTHHVQGGYYGYPYDYLHHPERHLPRISEHGGGSPCGGACYNEAAWPTKYHGSAFFAEWGKGKVQCFHLKASGASYTSEIEDFLTRDGGEELRPVDLCFSPDGKHMYVADWNYSGWLNPKVVGRVLRVTYVGEPPIVEPPRAKNSDPLQSQLESLKHPSFSERLRAQHDLARRGKAAVESLGRVARASADSSARIHALWALYEIDRRTNQPLNYSRCATATMNLDPEVRRQAFRMFAEVENAFPSWMRSSNPRSTQIPTRRSDCKLRSLWGAHPAAVVFQGETCFLEFKTCLVVSETMIRSFIMR